ncbi:substrate-binding domain-containing protein [Bacillus sp. FJAT-45350]|uniref:substrate-binding domain-containing protein n=1 Tax=Bacillus sp. FJAT-45350 TaxID=2011014 RepID=UPI000BB7D2DA|nr:helix-turn-helix transcriptional regulator [Bacillus sp. FJAT-45350]
MNALTYTPDEVAQLFKISKHTVYELIKRGELNAFKVGNKMRIEADEVTRYKKSTQANQTTNNQSIESPPIRLMGSHDFLIEQLTRFVDQHENSLQIQPSYIGSFEGLMMLYRGLADVCALHMFDPNSKEYNVPFIKQFFVLEKMTVVRLASREQGFIVAKGNPKGITNFKDLTKKEITYVNRQRGSGTRLLVDSFLYEQGIDPKRISGYEREEWTHLSTATYIANGKADVAFGIRPAAEQLGLDFISIVEEDFDIVFRWTKENETALTTLLELVCSKEFSDSISVLPGYHTSKLGDIIFDTRGR